MSDFIVLGTDTDAGKSTFAALFLSAFQSEFEYWKPLESGDSDSRNLRSRVPNCIVHPSIKHFSMAVAPPLAARHEKFEIPDASTIANQRPYGQFAKRSLLIETFGSPLSPLNESQLQIELIRVLSLPTLLVTTSAVGAIGRTLQTLAALQCHGIIPKAIILMGDVDGYAMEQIEKYDQEIPVFSLENPSTWDQQGFQKAAEQQDSILHQIRQAVSHQEIDNLDCLLQLDHQMIWHPYAALRDPDPLQFAKSAQDEFIILGNGRKVIDGFSSWWTILHGHRPPHLMSALAEATSRYDHVVFAGMTHEPAIRLAELLLASAPWPNGRVFYSDNGSTAVEVALKMAYQYWCHRGEPQRQLFVGFANSYHGDTFGAMSASRDPIFFGRFMPLLFDSEIVPVDANALDDCLKKNADRVAAVIIEPLVQGAGGMQMHSPAELAAIYEVCRTHGVLFIADEVMTGGTRLGPLWAHSLANIAPDFICASKTLAGGIMPVAATLVSPVIVSVFDSEDRTKTFFHGHSFTAHPLACHIAVTNWQELSKNPNPNPSRIEKFWHAHLSELQGHSLVRDLRIRGAIAAMELDLPGGYLAEGVRQLRRIALDHDVFLRPLGNVLYAMPPHCTSDDSLAKIATVFHAATTARWDV